MTRFAKQPERTLGSLAGEAVHAALRDAGVGADEVGFVAFGNAAAGILSGQEMVRGQVALQDTALAGLPIVNVENACASSSSAFHLAVMAVESGRADVAVAVGAERMSAADRQRVDVAFTGAVDVGRLADEHGDDVLASGAGPLFMNLYAEQAQAYMQRTGATAEDFAAVASKAHFHGSLNPRAQQRRALSVEEVLASRLVMPPLHLYMCSPIGDGAAAVVVSSLDWARRRHQPHVRVAASVVASCTTGVDDVVDRAASTAYEAAGVGPEELDVIELHDAASPAELMVLEQLQVTRPGEALKLAREGQTRLGGRIPVNPSGGLISKGHPIGATGCAQLVELTEQLLGRCGHRQVHGARVGLAENAGGWIGQGPAVSVVTILASDR
jgi:acetyl-CoA acyltransferase